MPWTTYVVFGVFNCSHTRFRWWGSAILCCRDCIKKNTPEIVFVFVESQTEILKQGLTRLSDVAQCLLCFVRWNLYSSHIFCVLGIALIWYVSELHYIEVTLFIYSIQSNAVVGNAIHFIEMGNSQSRRHRTRIPKRVFCLCQYLTRSA